MSRWDFECVLRDVRDHLRAAPADLQKAMEYVAEHWVDMEKAKKALESARAELAEVQGKLTEVQAEFEELKRERPVETPDDEGCTHGAPACIDCCNAYSSCD